MAEYVVCVRNTEKSASGRRFGSEPGPTKFLKVPGNRYPNPAQAIPRRQWVAEVLAKARSGVNAYTGQPTGDILVFIHGYNNSQEIVLKRHRRLQRDLTAAGYQGAVISYDWPSADIGLNYLEDRDDAKTTARRLRDDCINLFSSQQAAGCEINISSSAIRPGPTSSARPSPTPTKRVRSRTVPGGSARWC